MSILAQKEKSKLIHNRIKLRPGCNPIAGELRNCREQKSSAIMIFIKEISLNKVYTPKFDV